MRTRGGTRHAVLGSLALAVALSTAGGCNPSQRRAGGTTFEVRATLVQDTCGPQAAPVMRTVVFHVELGVNRDVASWAVSENGASASGPYVATTRGFRFAQDDQQLVRDVDRANGRAACVLRRLDVIDGTLSADLPPPGGDAGADADAGVDAGVAMDVVATNGDAGTGDAAAGDEAGALALPTLSATETVVYGAVAGADCSDQVGASDGQFLALPCQQVFDLSGTMVPPTTSP